MGLLSRIAAVLLVALIPFQDLPLPVGGRLGNNAVVWAIPAVFIVSMLAWRGAILATLKSNCITPLVSMWIYTIIMSIVYVGLVLPLWDFGEMHAVKAIKGAITFAAWLLAMVLFTSVALELPGLLKRVLMIMVCICAAVMICEAFIPNLALVDSGFLHTFPKINLRPRLWSTEASTAGAMLAGITLSYALIGDERENHPLVIAFGYMAVMVSTSKGALISFTLAIVWLLIFRRGSVLIKTAQIVCGFIVAAGVAIYAAENLIADYREYTSISTRSMFLLSNIECIKTSPLGTGFSGYLHYGRDWLVETARLTSGLFDNPNATRELDMYIATMDEDAFFPKDLFSMMTWWGGLVGSIIFLYWSYRLSMAALSVRKRWAVPALIFTFVVLVGFEGSFYQYGTVLLVATVVAEAIRASSRRHLPQPSTAALRHRLVVEH